MTLNKQLLDILACPVCKGKLIYDQDKQELICKFDKLVYSIQDGIPVMLEESAKHYTEEV